MTAKGAVNPAAAWRARLVRAAVGAVALVFVLPLVVRIAAVNVFWPLKPGVAYVTRCTPEAVEEAQRTDGDAAECEPIWARDIAWPWDIVLSRQAIERAFQRAAIYGRVISAAEVAADAYVEAEPRFAGLNKAMVCTADGFQCDVKVRTAGAWMPAGTVQCLGDDPTWRHALDWENACSFRVAAETPADPK
jgi:hypothetical protein